MNKAIFLLWACLLLNVSCVSKATVDTKKHETKCDSADLSGFYVLDTNLTYNEVRLKINSIRAGIDTNSISKDSLSCIFTRLFVYNLIPYWYGTGWSFEGHTSVPREGTIACGYFVSTTLKDMGFNLNKYTLAQQLPVHEAMSIQMDSDLLIIQHQSKYDNIEELRKRLQEGLYLIGFDQGHVGFLYKHSDLFLIHSNYLYSQGVAIERIEESVVFSNYSRFYIAEISTNYKLLRKWISKEEIKVIGL